MIDLTDAKKVFLETYGCPYGAALHDDFKHFKEDKRFRVIRLEGINGT